MRWQSRGFFVWGRSARTTFGPMVMLGTKRPSITSTWIQSAPAASTARTSSPSRLKSALRMEGATSTMALPYQTRRVEAFGAVVLGGERALDDDLHLLLGRDLGDDVRALLGLEAAHGVDERCSGCAAREAAAEDRALQIGAR